MMSKIIVCDDDKFLVEMIARGLEKNNYEVYRCNNGSQALLLAEVKDDVSLVITDLNMPGLNGLEFSAKLRSLPKYQNTPIIMLTSESEKEMVKKGRDIGITAWAVKPVNQNKILEIVSRALGQ